MPKLDHALWRDMMEYLRRRHAPICRQWFENLRPVALDSGLLRVYTATKIQQAYLQRRCVEQFTEAAQATTGALVAVRFVSSDEEPEPREAVPGAATATATLPALPQLPSHGTLKSHRPAPAATIPGGNGKSPAPAGAPAGHSGPTWQAAAVGELEPDELLFIPDYTFDTFVTGPNNRLAYAAAVAVANQPGTSYNPLFIHGGVGLGKTHLLQGICQKILTDRPDATICYLSCDAFMNRFLDCVQRGQMSEFRNRYRHADVLVIDDIHFLARREQSQEEFFHTFNALYQSNKQIVLSSDSPPSEIPQLEERLISRFQWGLVAEVTRPDYE
ncbi:MAG: ATP-binding protein, partial [Phycisphaeraceae bacterium]|nr:ATP-binding protein [Phycisphaeraceae bacterium]